MLDWKEVWSNHRIGSRTEMAGYSKWFESEQEYIQKSIRTDVNLIEDIIPPDLRVINFGAGTGLLEDQPEIQARMNAGLWDAVDYSQVVCAHSKGNVKLTTEENPSRYARDYDVITMFGVAQYLRPGLVYECVKEFDMCLFTDIAFVEDELSKAMLTKDHSIYSMLVFKDIAAIATFIRYSKIPNLSTVVCS